VKGQKVPRTPQGSSNGGGNPRLQLLDQITEDQDLTGPEGQRCPFRPRDGLSPARAALARAAPALRGLTLPLPAQCPCQAGK